MYYTFFSYYTGLFSTIQFYFVIYRFILYHKGLFCTIQVCFVLYSFILHYTILFFTIELYLALYSFIFYYTGLFYTVQTYFVLYRFISYYTVLFYTIQVYFNFSTQSKCPSLYTESCFLFPAICSHNLATDNEVLFALTTVYRHHSPRFVHLQVSFLILLHY